MADGAREPPIVRRAGPDDLTGAARCYARNGYGGRILPEDDVLVAERDGEIVGVVRLVREEGIRMLRGFFLDEAERGRGLGRSMLEILVAWLGAEPCWLICRRDLVPFYGAFGFRPEAGTNAPAHLPPRAAAYARAFGPQAILRRPGGGGHA